jgi:hypothetical protein
MQENNLGIAVNITKVVVDFEDGWSVHYATMEGNPRTNNVCEGWNNKFHTSKNISKMIKQSNQSRQVMFYTSNTLNYTFIHFGMSILIFLRILKAFQNE